MFRDSQEQAHLAIIVVTLRFMGRGTSIVNDKIHVCITKDPVKVYLLNTSDEEVSLNAGELMGFGPGSFKAVTPGLVR